MSGLCCRCQVRHEDWLCCRHGIAHLDDNTETNPAVEEPDTLLGVQRGAPPAEYDCPVCVRPRACNPCEHCGHDAGDFGGSELLLGIVVGVVMAAVIGACGWLGYSGVDPWIKFGAGVLLVVLTIPVLAWLERDVHSDRHPAAHRPGPVRDIESWRRGR